MPMGKLEVTPELYLKDGSPNLKALMKYDDDTFIELAYQLILHRAPDTEGKQYYLGRLRSGISKSRVLGQLLSSKELNKQPVAADSLIKVSLERYSNLIEFLQKLPDPSQVNAYLHKLRGNVLEVKARGQRLVGENALVRAIAIKPEQTWIGRQVATVVAHTPLGARRVASSTQVQAGVLLSPAGDQATIEELTKSIQNLTRILNVLIEKQYGNDPEILLIKAQLSQVESSSHSDAAAHSHQDDSRKQDSEEHALLKRLSPTALTIFKKLNDH